MVKVKSPMMSLSASGSLGGAIVFSTWKGTPYVRTLVKPVNPRSAAQTGIRAMLKYLAQIWAALSAGTQSFWDPLAENANISPFNAFVKHNMQRWREYHGPTTLPEPTVGANATTITQVLTGGQRNILVSVDPSAAIADSCVAIFRSAGVIAATNWNVCIAVVPAPTTDPVLFTDAPIVAGTYHYRSQHCDADGNLGVACADASATAT